MNLAQNKEDTDKHLARNNSFIPYKQCFLNIRGGNVTKRPESAV